MDQMVLYGVVAVFLIVPVKFLVPQMMDCDDARRKFAIGVFLFVIYTAILVLVCSYMILLAPIDTSRDYFVRCAVGVGLTNIAVLFSAFQYFFTRDKRKMTASEKMKLQDL